MAVIWVRQASTEDAELIAELSRITFYETYAPYNVKEDLEIFLSKTYTMDVLMKEVNEAGNIFFLAYEDDKVVGYLKLREHNDPIETIVLPAIEIARIYVIKSRIGKGAGKALMEKCIEIAKQKHKHIIWLAVWPKNQRAIDFYFRWGFEKFGEQDFIFVKEVQKDWLMKKWV